MRGLLGAVALLAALLVPAAAGRAQGAPLVGAGFGANDVDFLNMMGNVEGPDGFGDVFLSVPLLPPERLEEMTVGEVLAYQRQIRALGTASSAVGRYQFIHVTLQRLVVELGVSPDLVFDSEVQTFLARALMADCGFYEPTRASSVLADCLAGVWAALPVVTGPRRGLSAYAEDGFNRALVAPEAVLAVLDSRFVW